MLNALKWYFIDSEGEGYLLKYPQKAQNDITNTIIVNI